LRNNFLLVDINNIYHRLTNQIIWDLNCCTRPCFCLKYLELRICSYLRSVLYVCTIGRLVDWLW
jgi:hypothetical protein